MCLFCLKSNHLHLLGWHQGVFLLAAVPLLRAAFLFGSALIGMAMLGRGRKKGLAAH